MLLDSCGRKESGFHDVIILRYYGGILLVAICFHKKRFFFPRFVLLIDSSRLMYSTYSLVDRRVGELRCPRSRIYLFPAQEWSTANVTNAVR